MIKNNRLKKKFKFSSKAKCVICKVADLIAGLLPQAKATSLTSLLKTFVPANRVYSAHLFRQETGFH